MAPQNMSNAIVLLGLAVSVGLGWLQWRLWRRVFQRLNEWVAVSIVAAAVSTPLTVGLVTDALVQAGLPAAAVFPLGVGLLLSLVVADVVWVGVLAWALEKWPFGAWLGAGRAK